MNKKRGKQSPTKKKSTKIKENGSKIRSRASESKPDDFKILTNIMDNQDINQLIGFLKLDRKVNMSNIMDLSSEFIDQHKNGVEIFLKTAISLEPENALHHYNYALFLETRKAYDLALDEFETATKLDNKNDSYHVDFGNLLFKLKDFNGAEKEYKAALQINSNNAHVWTNLGKLYFEKEETKKAEKALKKAINIDPYFPLSYLNLLQLYEHKGLEVKARALWKTYQNINGNILNINNLKLNFTKDDKDQE